MSEFPLGYKVIPPVSWAYMASLLTIALYFKFNRVWSVRNLDLMLLILLAPGLLYVYEGSRTRQGILKDGRVRVLKAYEDSFRSIRNRSNSEEKSRISLAAENGPSSNSNGIGIGGKRKGAVNSGSVLSDQGGGDPNVFDDTNGLPTVKDKERSEKSLPSEKLDTKDDQELKISEIIANLDNNSKNTYYASQRLEFFGYIWLFTIGVFLTIRMLIDPMMVRRPQLDPNMTFGGLTFLGVALLLFLFVNITSSKPTPSDMYGAESAVDLVKRRASNEGEQIRSTHGPGYALMHLIPIIPTFVSEKETINSEDTEAKNAVYEVIAKSVAIICQLAVVVGIFFVGWWHFGNPRVGVGMAALYLILPYTAQMTGRVVHVMPAAFMVWAFVFYRRPVVAGIFVGMAAGIVYYPLFLLPLWLSFYWPRGRTKFLIGVTSTLGVLAISLIFRSTDFADYLANLRTMFGVWSPQMEGLQGIWALGWDSIYRIPLLMLFVVLSSAFAIWPAQKNLGTLFSCSAAVMLVVQFWHGFGGGLLMAWYLPIVIMTIFRPNLEDRVATKVVSRKSPSPKAESASTASA